MWSSVVKAVVGAEVFRGEEEVDPCPCWRILTGYGRISVVEMRIYEVED